MECAVESSLTDKTNYFALAPRRLFEIKMLYKTFGPLHELYYIDIFQRITIQLLGEENEE
ncbi:unnamed protein product, partial [Ceratitis capitata]